MPETIDAIGGLRIPTGSRLLAILGPIYRAIRQQSARAVQFNRDVGLSSWAKYLYEAVVPEFTNLVTVGAHQEAKEERTQRLPTATSPIFSPPPISPTSIVMPASEGGKPFVQIDWNIFHPEIADIARRSAWEFASSVSQTSLTAIRQNIADGLAAGETRDQIAKRIEKLPEMSPKRARRVAQYEASRAAHAGQSLVAKRNGAAGMEWIASKDACPVCLSIMKNKKRVRFGEPFYVWPKPGPYQIVYHPPAHVSCMCSCSPWFDGE